MEYKFKWGRLTHIDANIAVTRKILTMVMVSWCIHSLLKII